MSAPPTTAPTLTVTVACAPPSLNMLLRAHWSVRRNLVQMFTIYAKAAMNALPPVQRRVFPLDAAAVRVTVYYCGRQQDMTNAIGGSVKVAEDGLVAAGVCVDDSPEHMTLLLPRSVRVPHRAQTRVVVEVWPRRGGEEP